jgi:hypothetical protein
MGFERRDLIAQRQLALLQAGHPNLIMDLALVQSIAASRSRCSSRSDSSRTRMNC